MVKGIEQHESEVGLSATFMQDGLTILAGSAQKALLGSFGKALLPESFKESFSYNNSFASPVATATTWAAKKINLSDRTADRLGFSAFYLTTFTESVLRNDKSPALQVIMDKALSLTGKFVGSTLGKKAYKMGISMAGKALAQFGLFKAQQASQNNKKIKIDYKKHSKSKPKPKSKRKHPNRFKR